MIGRLALVGALVVAAGCGGDERELAGLTYDTPQRVDAVTLPDVSQDGEPFEFRAQPGGLLLVYFGYTNCPHECPATLTDVHTVLGELGDDAERVDVAMVTVDPVRDTEVLADFVQSFVDGGHAIATDDDEALRAVASSFGVAYEVVTAPDGTVEVGHSTYLFAVDDEGSLAVTWPFGTEVDDLEADIAQMLDSAA